MFLRLLPVVISIAPCSSMHTSKNSAFAFAYRAPAQTGPVNFRLLNEATGFASEQPLFALKKMGRALVLDTVAWFRAISI